MPKMSNWVCVRKSDGKVARIKRDEAESLAKEGKAEFVPRSVWKKEVRDVNKGKETAKAETEKKPRKRKGNPKGKASKKTTQKKTD